MTAALSLEKGELIVQFKVILGLDEAMEHSALVKEHEELYHHPGWPLTILDRPSREELITQYSSYRCLPTDVRPCRLASFCGRSAKVVV